MSNTQIIRLLVDAIAIIFVIYCVYREKDIAKWERKVWKYVKSFFKAVIFTVQEKSTTNRCSKIIEFPKKQK